VLLVNIILTIVMLQKFGLNMGGGIAMVYQGTCEQTESLDSWVHLAVNSISTALLCGSNYCMQLLSAPSRNEVDKAHTKRKWLDIGTASIRNLSFVSKKKVMLYWLLGVSSIPLHLLYGLSMLSRIQC